MVRSVRPSPTTPFARARHGDSRAAVVSMSPPSRRGVMLVLFPHEFLFTREEQAVPLEEIVLRFPRRPGTGRFQSAGVLHVSRSSTGSTGSPAVCRPCSLSGQS